MYDDGTVLTIHYYGRLTRTGTQNKQTHSKLLNGNTTGIKVRDCVCYSFMRKHSGGFEQNFLSSYRNKTGYFQHGFGIYACKILKFPLLSHHHHTSSLYYVHLDDFFGIRGQCLCEVITTYTYLLPVFWSLTLLGLIILQSLNLNSATELQVSQTAAYVKLQLLCNYRIRGKFDSAVKFKPSISRFTRDIAPLSHNYSILFLQY